MSRLKPLVLEPIGEPPGLLWALRRELELEPPLPPALGVGHRLRMPDHHEPHGGPALDRALSAIAKSRSYTLGNGFSSSPKGAGPVQSTGVILPLSSASMSATKS